MWLKTIEIYSLIVLEVRSLKSRCQQGRTPSEGSSHSWRSLAGLGIPSSAWGCPTPVSASIFALPSPNIPLVNYIFHLSQSRMVSITCFQHTGYFWILEILFLLHSTICCCCCFVPKSSPTLCDFMDCSPPGSSAHGIFQARVLEWGAIAFSD